MSKGIEMKHNGIEYEEETLRDVTRYDGGAMGGVITRYPSGAYHVNNHESDWQFTFEKAAEAAQAMQRKKYETYRKFVMQYEKEAKN